MDWGNIKQSEQIKCAIHLTSQRGWITWRAQLKTVWPLVESTSFNAWKISLQNRKAKWPQNSFVFIPDLVFKRYVQLFKWKCPLFFAKLPEREWLKNDNKKFSVWFVERTRRVCRPCRATTRCLDNNKQKKSSQKMILPLRLRLYHKCLHVANIHGKPFIARSWRMSCRNLRWTFLVNNGWPYLTTFKNWLFRDSLLTCALGGLSPVLCPHYPDGSSPGEEKKIWRTLKTIDIK